MKYIKSIFYFYESWMRKSIKNIFSKELQKPMGRWNIDYCNKKINNKIDLSNEDHCGPCGQYALTKIENTKTITKKTI